MSSTPCDKNASTPTGVPYRPLPAPRDVSDTTSPMEIVAAVTRQFDAGATTVVVHGHDGRTARITTPDDVTVDDDVVEITADDGRATRVPPDQLTIVAGTDNDLAAIPLGARIRVTYESQASQHDTQERTGTVTDWTPTRYGSVYWLSLTTDIGDQYHIWTNTGGVDKGPQGSQRKVGHDADVEVLDAETAGDA